MVKIALSNQKGGVGKTTVTFNLAAGLVERGYTVLMVDNDPQGNLTGCCLEDPTTLPESANLLRVYTEDDVPLIQPYTVKKHLDLLGADIRLAKVTEGDFEVIYKLRDGLEAIETNYDFILIDCLPSFGFLNLAALNAADQVIIPTKPAPFSIAGLKDLFETIDRVQRRMNKGLAVVGILLNMIEGRNTRLAKDIESVLRERYSNLVFQTTLGKGVKLEESPSFNQSIMEYDPTGKQTQQFIAFIDELLDRLSISGKP
jgi:chromosome partitioning protein